MKKFIDQCMRVLKTTRKPNKKEFSATAKVSGIGMLVIGMIGFIIFIIKQLFV